MAPKSTIGIPDIELYQDVNAWLKNKRTIDNLGKLWRIHDGLYDFSSFIKSHPGGESWIEDTQGTDITEAFESHHISTLPEGLLKKYYVKEIKTPRTSPFTFREDGFYRTVKRNVREALKTIPKGDIKYSNLYTDALLIGTFIFAVLATIYWNFTCGVISGIFFGLTIIATHNYSHQKDNFRMYYGDICLQNYRDWRILHIVSHHMLTNTIADMQTYLGQPFVNYYPEKKSIIMKYGSVIYEPLMLWTTVNFFLFLSKIFKIVNCVWRFEKIKTNDLLPFLIPLTMYLLGGQTFVWTIVMWEFILAVGNFCFAFVGFTGTHIHPDVFLDGDKARTDERDWGVNQLDTVSDRYEVTGNHFLVLITFGDHALHHLFPTLDHGVLHHLYPVVEKTMKEFNLNIRMTTHVHMFAGYFRRIATETPNPNPPSLKSK